jgi:hypothetical protein
VGRQGRRCFFTMTLSETAAARRKATYTSRMGLSYHFRVRAPINTFSLAAANGSQACMDLRIEWIRRHHT